MSYEQPQQMRFQTPKMTWGVQRLILACVGVFALQLLLDPIQYLIFSGYSQSMRFPGGMLNIWFGFQPDLLLRYGLIWKPFTYMFLHSGLMHLFMNMLWLFVFGPEVERSLGTRQFFRFYIVCGAVGVLATFFPYLLQGDSVSVIGASGAAMGVMVAFAMIDPDRQFYLFPLPWPINARALVIIVVVMNIVMSLNNGNSVSVHTHFGGMATGYLYIKFLPDLNKWWRKRKLKVVERPEKAPESPKSETIGKVVDEIFESKRKDL